MKFKMLFDEAGSPKASGLYEVLQALFLEHGVGSTYCYNPERLVVYHLPTNPHGLAQYNLWVQTEEERLVVTRHQSMAHSFKTICHLELADPDVVFKLVDLLVRPVRLSTEVTLGDL